MSSEPDSYFAVFRRALDDGERPSRVIVFADIVGSTEMKAKGEVTWLPTVGKFYDVVEDAVKRTCGSVVKYLGDGAILAYGDDQAAEAINAAILIHESLEGLRHENKLQCRCSIGITTGRPVPFTVGEASDFIGTSVDLAARLSGAANPDAIWADASTVSAANMARVTSAIGRAMRRDAAGYRTGEESVKLKGFTDPISYHEIIWASAAFGVRNSVVTQILRDEKPDAGQETGRPRDDSRTWSLGRVVSWDQERGMGYVRGDGEGQDRFVLKHWLVGTEALAAGSRIAFFPEPPAPGKRNGVAVRVVSIGQPIQGLVRVAPPGRDFIFVEVRDANRTPHTGLIYCPRPKGEVILDEWLSVTPIVDRVGRLALEVG